jgi:hypothetical protein
MRTMILLLAIAAVASAQPSAPAGSVKVIYLANVDAPQSMQEILNIVRTMGEIKDASLDPAKKSITVHGTADQIAVAQWLCGELDKATPPVGAKRQYTVPNSNIPVLQVFFLAHIDTQQFLQEAVNAVRSLADIQRFFPYFGAKAIVARGTVDEVAFAGWLLGELDTPVQPIQTAVIHDHPVTYVPARSGSLAQVFFLAHTETPLAMMEAVNLTRSMAEIQRLFPVNQHHALLMRGTPEQIAFANWILMELDKPVSKGTAATLEYKVPQSLDRTSSVAHLMYLSNPHQPQAVLDLIKEIRTTTSIQRMFYDSAHNAVAMRGTGDQVARAEQLIKEHDNP